MNALKYILLGLTFAGLLHSCGDDNEGIHFGDEGAGNTGTVTPSTNITSRMETPEVLKDGSTQLIAHFSNESNDREVMTYSLEYDKEQLHSRWVAFRFDGDTRARNVSRSDDAFADDPKLPNSLKIGSRSFGGGYDRGHLCASADRLYSGVGNRNTFYMTNMSPQKSSFNQGYWVTLEGKVQKLGRDKNFSDTLYVVKGGTIRNNQIIKRLSRPNGTKTVVPKYYFMALLKIKNGVYSSIAFWMEHKEYGYNYGSPAPLSVIKKHAISVNDLEAKTGINFFPNLSNDREEDIEDQFVPGNWGF